MQARVVRIGNSRGICIPKAFLDQCCIENVVELEVEDGRLVVRPAKQARLGWEDAFRRMAESGDDALLDQQSLGPIEWEMKEWVW